MSDFDKNMADTLCTVITLGYIAEEVSNLPIPTSTPPIERMRKGSSIRKENRRTPATKIQYAPGEESKYGNIQKLFSKFGVNFEISPSKSQDMMPYVIAKNHQFDLDTLREITAEDRTYLTSITDAVETFSSAPRGAYIGGKNTLEGIDIIGPSQLEFATPRYRNIGESDAQKIKEAYDKAKEDTNKAIKCLSPNWVSHPIPGKKRKVTINKLIPEIKADMDVSKKQVFKSYHGMIQAMINHEAAICNDKNLFFFEIALGSNTTKVSSCIPCSMFMTSVDMPPISTHLGRGDNWNIPQIPPEKFATDIQTKSWYSNIISYYLFGKHQLYTQKTEWSANLLTRMNNIERFITEKKLENVPLIFLEALTFEESFTTRITNTLG